MTKCELLKKLHKLVWQSDDLMEQDVLFEIQHIIDQELWREQMAGNVELKQLSNGFIKRIKILKKNSFDQALQKAGILPVWEE
jgi:hypothetical protein